MIGAAFGVRIFSENVTGWQIDAVKKYANKLKDEEIDHSELAQTEKERQKNLLEQWLDETTKGFKELLRREGRMEIRLRIHNKLQLEVKGFGELS